MPSKLILCTSTSKYLIARKGFKGTKKTASRFPCFADAEEALEDIGKFGLKGFRIVDSPEGLKEKGKMKRLRIKDKKNPGIVQNKDGSSWGIFYTSAKKGKEGKKPSARRFASQQEAEHHGRRFMALKGHTAIRVVQMPNEDVNSWVNWKSGNTNPKLDRDGRPVADKAVAKA